MAPSDSVKEADRRVLSRMWAHGGEFVRLLAKAWIVADAANSARLMLAFGDVYDKYAALAEGGAS